jgi:hypothetical protein
VAVMALGAAFLENAFDILQAESQDQQHDAYTTPHLREIKHRPR